MSVGRIKEGTPATCWPCVLCGAGSRIRESGLPLEGRTRRRIRCAFQMGHQLPTAAWMEKARLGREGSQEGPQWELHLGSEKMGPALCGLHSLELKRGEVSMIPTWLSPAPPGCPRLPSLRGMTQQEQCP